MHSVIVWIGADSAVSVICVQPAHTLASGT